MAVKIQFSQISWSYGEAKVNRLKRRGLGVSHLGVEQLISSLSNQTDRGEKRKSPILLLFISSVPFTYKINERDMAVDLVVSIAAKIGEYLVAPIGRRLGYLISYNTNVDLLRTRLRELKNAQVRVQGSVNVAERNLQDILPDVRCWLTSVNGVVEAYEQFFNDDVKANQRCFVDWSCPNLKSRYQVSRKAKKKMPEVDELLRKGNFNAVSIPRFPPTIGSTIIGDLKVFQSRKSTFNLIMEALKDGKVGVIGVSGMGGIGKTTLVKQVAKQAEEDKIFDKIVMAVVSQTPNVRKIQGEIVDMVGLELKEESESGCNILLTSRDEDLYNQMNTQAYFPIEVLSPPEAWDLFRKMAGNFDDSPDLHNLAMEVAKECAGLPIVIGAVATALKSKSSQFWRDALIQFKNSTPQNIRGMDIAYSKLQLSYDLLERKELKSCFLLCRLFPEDYDILIEDLVRYGMGLRLFENIHNLEEARDRALVLVDILKARCLLLAGNVESSVRMHDVIRDMALSVAYKGEHVFLVKVATELEELPKFHTFANHIGIVLLPNNFHELPNRFDCPELNILVLGLEWEFFHSSSLKIPDTLMKMMKVLVMRSMPNPSLPPSIQCLKNLRTLCLEHCVLSDTSFIGELKEKLEILSFRGSDIKDLPREIGQLTHLRLLDLSNCTYLKLIPSGVISSLSHLEDLYMINSFKNWEVDDKDTGKRNASLAEMKSLSQIRVLEMHIPDIKLFPKYLLFGNLIKFKISIGHKFDSYWYREIYENSFQRIFKFNLDQSITLYSGFHMLLKRVEYFILEDIEDLGNVLCDSKTDGFSGLKWLKVQGCGGNEYLIDTTG
ncbi:hypothetical protein F0562_010963 [Nyssa sinensis]|uniref:NB-ARC domain-containing protein n=1 Tax=Nyssa sinensis TaxID=561372 RepID=A0A5J5A259_9ASTE|nr:hypothetical protein F0562_010963 [Nyssa sinensis]